MLPYVTKLRLKGFKRFADFELPLQRRFNILVGDNETGKSTLLEALTLVLAFQSDGRTAYGALDPFWFNKGLVEGYFSAIRAGDEHAPPTVVIEAYLACDTPAPELSRLKGTANHAGEDCPGVHFKISVQDGLAEELKAYATDDTNPPVVPVEYYRAEWLSFAGNTITARSLPLKTATIDMSRSRAARGPNRYVGELVGGVLSEEQRRDLALEYRRLRHSFSGEAGVRAINDHLRTAGTTVTTKALSIQMDLSARTTWDQSMAAHLDELPFELSGKGEQAQVQMKLALASNANSHVVLIEEPENHLSHSNLNGLLDEIQTRGLERQIIVTTHSGYVLNKLGLDGLRLISRNGQSIALTGLSDHTLAYFKRLPGYDTLRLVLAKRSILVEGPSDELVVHKAYEHEHGKPALADGVDVISVGSLAFKRFLEIAAELRLEVTVVTDNDGDLDKLRAKYAAYLTGAHPSIRILFDEDVNAPSLEDQLVKKNGQDVMNAALGTALGSGDELISYMKARKTDCALRLFETNVVWEAPEYIQRAVDQ